MLDVDTQFTAVLAAPQEHEPVVVVGDSNGCPRFLDADVFVAGGIADRFDHRLRRADYSGGRCATSTEPTIDHIYVFT